MNDGQSWFIAVFPYIEQTAVFDKWNNEIGYDHIDNTSIVKGIEFEALRCPSSPLDALTPTGSFDTSEMMVANYVGIAGAAVHDGSPPRTSSNDADRNNSNYFRPILEAPGGNKGIASAGGVLFPHSRVRIGGIMAR